MSRSEGGEGGTAQGASASDTLSPVLLGVVGQIPNARVRRSRQPGDDARRLATRAALKAALTAGSLALPTGPLGWLTVLPEMRAVWKIQAQLVADIAALHGRKSELTQEQVLYCLFRHSASAALRDLLVRVGDRFVVGRAPAWLLQLVARKIAARVLRRVAGTGLARWLPVAGAIGVGAFAYRETARVGINALELFGDGIVADAAPAEVHAGTETGAVR